MSETIEVDGEEHELNGDPTLGTVREIQSMETDLFMQYLDEDDLKNMDSLDDESAIVSAIVDQGGMEALEEVQWDRSMIDAVQTISLAADNPFDTEDFDPVPAQEFKEMREKAEESLGGNDAEGFFKELGIGMSLTEEQMNRARAMQ